MISIDTKQAAIDKKQIERFRKALKKDVNDLNLSDNGMEQMDMFQNLIASTT